jgi:hypothetical protein
MKAYDITELVDFVERSDGSMSIEPKRSDCGCPQGVCQPQHNEGTWCWRSACLVPVGYFSASITASQE